MDNLATAEATLRFPYTDAPAPGEIWEVAPGVGWLRMPLPGPLNHINLWVLRDRDGVTLVDTGMPTDEAKAIWEDLLEGPLQGLKVQRVLCTHHHPDHMGLSGWLTARTGAPLHVTKPEFEAAGRWQSWGDDKAVSLILERCRRTGLDPDLARTFMENSAKFRDFLGAPPPAAEFLDPTKPVVAAETEWQVIVGRGHSPELVALYSPQLEVLISSDQVLPKISPNISVSPENPDANPLAEYLDTLRPFRRLPADTLVLPSHRQLFYGLHTRVDDLTMHHVERLDTTRVACADGGATAAEVMAKLFLRKLDGHNLFVALAETIAHLNFLIATGDIVRERSDGADLYRAH